MSGKFSAEPWHWVCSNRLYNEQLELSLSGGMIAMMKQLVLVGVLAAALSESAAFAQAPASLGTVTLSKKLMADGKPLAPGTYQVRLTSDEVKPATGQSPDSEKWVEFVKGGKVVGCEV